MSHIANEIILDEIQENRGQWLEDHGHETSEVFENERGEYVLDVVDMEPSEAGGIYERKLYLPVEATLRLLEREA